MPDLGRIKLCLFPKFFSRQSIFGAVRGFCYGQCNLHSRLNNGSCRSLLCDRISRTTSHSEVDTKQRIFECFKETESSPMRNGSDFYIYLLELFTFEVVILILIASNYI